MKLPETFAEDNYVNIVIETPCGSTNKYDYDPEMDAFKLKKILPFGVTFPLDFGFIPNTKGGDGDPLDVLLISDFPTCTGIILECRIIGVLVAEQKEKGKKKERNDRYIAVAKETHRYSKIKSLDDLDKSFLKELIGFFEYYNAMTGKKFTLASTKNGKAALKMIQQNVKK